MNLTNIAIAQAIATRALETSGHADILHHETVTDLAPFDGVLIFKDGDDERGVHVYLCDEEEGNEQWMIDPTNFITGDVNPKPLTAANLTAALDWLLEQKA